MSTLGWSIAPVIALAALPAASQGLRPGLTWPIHASLVAFRAASVGATCKSLRATETLCEVDNPSSAWSLGLAPCARAEYLFGRDGRLDFIRLHIGADLFAHVIKRAAAADGEVSPKTLKSHDMTSRAFTWYEGNYRLIASQSRMAVPDSHLLTTSRLDVSRGLSTPQIAQGVGS